MLDEISALELGGPSDNGNRARLLEIANKGPRTPDDQREIYIRGTAPLESRVRDHRREVAPSEPDGGPHPQRAGAQGFSRLEHFWLQKGETSLTGPKLGNNSWSSI